AGSAVVELRRIKSNLMQSSCLGLKLHGVADRLANTSIPFTVSLSMTLGDFIDVLQQNGYTVLARRVTFRDHSTTDKTQFPLELTQPGPINLPSIPRDGRGRPASLTNARARKIIAAGCEGASVPACR